jgi:uncharacterized protein
VFEDIRGANFPFRIDPATGGVAMASGSDKIRQNVRIILGTRVGERPMLREFGTRIPTLVHDPNDDVLADLIQNQARQALLQWEPRILITNMVVAHNEGEARLRLDYIYTSEQVADQMNIPLG